MKQNKKISDINCEIKDSNIRKSNLSFQAFKLFLKFEKKTKAMYYGFILFLICFLLKYMRILKLISYLWNC